jgi:DNA-nicking Smr family endonuclease
VSGSPRGRGADATRSGFTIEVAGEHVRALGPGVDAKHLRRLARGEVAIDVEIELHGENSASAKRLVSDTLHEMMRADERCARIVHGRGRHSEAGPVLKAGVLDWLTSPPLAAFVLCFCSAPPEEGGAGATLVLLRRVRPA